MELEGERHSLLVWGNSKKFQKIVKKHCLKDLLDCIGFIKQGPEPSYSVFMNGLVCDTSGDRYQIKTTSIDDEFHGTFNDVKFNITEVRNCHIQTKIDTYSNTYWSGFVINLEFNKEIKSEIYVLPKNNKHDRITLLTTIFFALFGLLCLIKGAVKGLFVFICYFLVLISNRFKKVKLEDINFSDKYNVLAGDQIEARYILTPAFIDRLNNLKTALSSKEVWCVFKGNQVIMAFETEHDMFEVGELYKPLTDLEQIRQFILEIMTITDIINNLKLYEKTKL